MTGVSFTGVSAYGTNTLDTTSTSTAVALVTPNYSVLRAANTTSSDTIFVSSYGKVIYQATAGLPITAGGHMVGNIGWSVVNSPGQTVGLSIALEGKVEVLAGTVTTQVATESQLTQNSGTIGTLILHNNNIVGNAGTISAAFGNTIQVAGNTGTIGVMYGYHFPNLAASGVAVRMAFYGQDVSAPGQNLGGWLNGRERLAPAMHPGYVVGRYYSAPHTALAAVAVSANLIYYMPMHIATKTTFTKIGVEVTTAVAGNMRLGIYNAANGVPTSLVVDAGVVASGTTGVKELTISQSLEEGNYYLCLVASAAPTINWHVPDAGMRLYMYGSSSSTIVNEQLLISSFTYAALPSTAPATAYVGTSAEPHLWLRP